MTQNASTQAKDTNPLARSAQRVVNAPADVIFDLLAHPARHSEIDGSTTVQGQAYGPERLSLGDRFGMKMANGARYTSTSTVVEFEEGRRIAWRTATDVRGHLLFGGQVWGYELTSREDGSTLVRETYDVSRARPKRLLAMQLAKTEKNLRETLERLATKFS